MRDDRPLKLIRRTPVDEGHLAMLEQMAEQADALAAKAGKDLQSEFGKQHIALIIGCNQFVRFYRDGDHTGQVELWLDPASKEVAEAAGLTLGPALGGAVFQMFGWCSIDPTENTEAALSALEAAAIRALTPAPTTSF